MIRGGNTGNDINEIDNMESRRPDIAHETLRALALCHNYNQWIYRIIEPYVGKKILEVGCGVGNMTTYLKKSGEVIGIDCTEKYIEYMKIDFPDIKIHNFNIMDENVLELKEHDFDTVVCINVLEHVKDDLKALVNMYKLLKSDGRLVLIVPAHKLLYGSLDVKVDHWRRYSRKELSDKLVEAGFEIQRLDYFNRIGVFGWFFNSRVLKREQISILQMMLYNRFIPFISKIDSIFNLPFGQSMFVVGKKK